MEDETNVKPTLSFLQSRDIAILAVITFITVFAWIFAEVYSTATKKDIPSQTQKLIEPINPAVREDVLQRLQNAEQ